MPVTSSDLVVEDGTGVDGANTYLSLADTTEYHRLRGNDLWEAASENHQVISLIRATQYLDTRWIYKDEIASSDQPLEWPRNDIEDRYGYDVSDSVPVEIKDACAEYALVVLGDGTALVELSPTPDQSNALSVKSQRDKVGPIETETRYETSVGVRVTSSFPKADRIIRRSGFTTLASSGAGISIR